MKSVFITGGSHGIGRATAELFAKRGWRVGIGDIAEPEQELASAITRYRLDVREREQWQRALSAFAGDGGLDVLVNNAGIVRYGAFEDIAAADADAIIDVNVKGPINGAYVGLPFLRRKRGSMLINVASAAALYGGARIAVYSASKGGVRGLSEALDAEWARYGVRVRCIMPWMTDTAMVHLAGTHGGTIREDLGHGGIDSVDKVADAIWAALHGNRLHHPVGIRGRAMQALVRLRPGLLRSSQRAQMKAP